VTIIRRTRRFVIYYNHIDGESISNGPRSSSSITNRSSVVFDKCPTGKDGGEISRARRVNRRKITDVPCTYGQSERDPRASYSPSLTTPTRNCSRNFECRGLTPSENVFRSSRRRHVSVTLPNVKNESDEAVNIRMTFTGSRTIICSTG